MLEDDIRLVELIPSDDLASQVECRIEHFDINSRSLRNPGTTIASDRSRNPALLHSDVAVDDLPEPRFVWGDFVALSYTWGDPSYIRTILLNGIPFVITENLEACLRLLRSKPLFKAGWRIWVDALCIDQKNIIERASQVKRMRDLYSRAYSPVAWLGPTADDSDSAIELIRELTAEVGRPDQVARLTERVRNHPEQFAQGQWRALYDFVLRRYWQRVWILQEVVLGGPDMPVLCGTQTLRWSVVSNLFWLLFHVEEIANVRIKAELTDVGRSLDTRFWKAALIVGEIQSLQDETSFEDARTRLYRLLTLSRNVAATDLRDKIYGMLALFYDDVADKIEPSYTNETDQIYVDFAKLAIEATQSLDFMRHVSTENRMTLPSWVPDWTADHLNSSLTLTFAFHKASLDSTAQVSYPGPTLLSCTGLLVDTVDGLGCTWSNSWDPTSVHPSTSQFNPYGSFEAARSALWRALVADRDVNIEPLTQDYSVLLSAPAVYDARVQITQDGALKDIAHSHLLEWCVQAMRPNFDLVVAGAPMRQYLELQPDLQAIDGGRLRDTLASRDRFGVRRRLMTTSKGYIGLTSDVTRSGDVVCVLLGCSMPMILRPVGNRYTVIGECYVHGLMDGEAMGMLERGDLKTQDFVIE